MSIPKSKRRIQKRPGRAAHGSLHRPCSAYLVSVTLKIPADMLYRLTKNALKRSDVELVSADWDKMREVWPNDKVRDGGH